MRGWSGWLWMGATLIALAGRGRAQSVPPPTIHASAILMEAKTGKVLFAHNAEQSLPPASTTKIATGLLLAQHVPPDQPIRISPNAAKTPGHALGTRPGETLAAKDLLYAVLLPSANDASEAAAEKIAGNDAAFAALMNQLAQDAGANQTHFVNPHGLPATGHLSTAHDLALLARAALRDPRFAAAVRTRTYTITRDGNRPPTPVVNQNDLLGHVPGMDGVKTGYTREAGYCFVGSATRRGRQLITVVLHSSDWRKETIALLDYGFALLAKSNKSTTTHKAEAPRNDSRPGATAPSTARPDDTKPEAAKADPRPEAASSGAIRTYEIKPDETGSSETTPSAAESNAAEPGEAKPTQAEPDDTNADITAQSGTQPEPTQSGQVAKKSASKKPTSPALPVRTPPVPPGTGAQSFVSPAASIPSGVITPTGTVHSLTSSGKPIAGDPRYAAWTRRYAWPDLGAFASGLRRFPWWWLLVLIAALAGLARKRGFAMRLPNLLAGGWKRKRKPHTQRVAPIYTTAKQMTPEQDAAPQSVTPPFTFEAPVLPRHEGRTWLHTILDNAPRLLEPFVRRQARALLEADPLVCDDRVRALLTSNNPKLRVVGAELLAPHAPLRAEETLLGMVEDEQIPPALRAEAIRLLADIGGDRHERLWTQMLLRDGTPTTAAALARLPRLTDPTRQALSHVLHAPRPTPSDNDTALRLQLRDAYIASVLAAHGGLSETAWEDVVNKLPENHRQDVVLNTLTGVTTAHATEMLMQVALRGPAYAGMQALMEQHPQDVRMALGDDMEKMDSAVRTRALILKWLLLGEGDRAAIQKLADAGNDLARGALQLAQQQRWDATQASPDALLAAAQIISLRLGYTPHSPEQIAQAFRKVAVDEERGSALAQAPELQTLARAYTHPQVYDAVQTGLYTEDGMHSLLAPLAAKPDNPAYRAELIFWSDKMDRPARLMLTQALATSQGTAEEAASTREALLARAGDHCPLIRATALRALHARPQPSEMAQESQLEKQGYPFAPVEEGIRPPGTSALEPESEETLNQAA